MTTKMTVATGTVHVCEGCRDADPAKREAGIGGGAALLSALRDALDRTFPDASLSAAGYRCLGNCAKRVRASIAGPGRWSWLFGDLSEADIPALLAFVSAWRAAPDGLVAKGDRPESLRPKILGRMPPAL